MAITLDMRTKVAQLYVSLFGRAPESDGLGYWLQQWDSGALKSIQEVAQAMFNTAPARITYPALSTPEEIVTKFYTNVLGRAPDADGLTYWKGQLVSKSVGTVVVDLINAVMSYTGTDVAALASKALLTNKVTVGLTYAVDKAGNDPVIAAQINAAVTATDTTAALAIIDNATNKGDTFTLTAGIDTITGTAKNDTINSIVDGGFSALDKIDGGAGNDTLNIASVPSISLTGLVTTVKNVENAVVSSAGNVTGSVEAWAGLETLTVAAGNGGVEINTGDVSTLDVTGKNDLSIHANDGALKTLSITGFSNSSSALYINSDSINKLTLNDVTREVNLNNTEADLNLVSNIGTAIYANSATSLNATFGGDSFFEIGSAKALTLNATADAYVGMSASSTKSITVSGKGAVRFDGFASKLETVTATSKSLTADISSFGSGTEAGYVTSVDVSGTTSANTIRVGGSTKYVGGNFGDKLTILGDQNSTVTLGTGNDTLMLDSVVLTSKSATINAGSGSADTLVLNTVNAAAASVNANFSKQVTGFEKLSLTNGVAASIDIAGLNGAGGNAINHVITAGNGGGAVNAYEIQTITFAHLDSGESVTVGGRTVTATGGSLTSSQVASAFADGVTAGNAVVSGSFAFAAGFNATVNSVSIIATTNGDQAPLVISTTNAVAPTVSVAVSAAGSATVGATPESAVYNFTQPLKNGASVTINGLTVTATAGTASVADVIQAFLTTSSQGSAVVTGTWGAGWGKTGTATSLTVSASGLGAQTDIVTNFTTALGVDNLAAVTSGTYTQGANTVPGTNAVQTLTFSGLLQGQSVTVDGMEVTASTGDLTAVQVAQAFNGVVAANAIVNGFLNTWTLSAILGNTIQVTSNSEGPKSALVPTITNVPTVTPTISGLVNGSTLAAVTLSNFVANGTIEATGANANTVVVLKDATGSADVLNVVLNNSSSVGSFGSITAAGVETVNISLVDATTGSAAAASVGSFTLNAAAATKVVVAGNNGLNLTGTTLTKVATFDASGVGPVTTGTNADTAEGLAVTFISANVNGASITGGAGDDFLRGNAGNDILVGNAGVDILNGGSGGIDTFTGGSGQDIFVLGHVAAAGLKYSTISDFSSNDSIAFTETISNTDANAAVAGNQLGAAMAALNANAVFQDYLDAATAGAVNGKLAWFVFDGATYIVQDNSGANTFQNGVDNVIKLAGSVDLTNSKFFGNQLFGADYIIA